MLLQVLLEAPDLEPAASVAVSIDSAANALHQALPSAALLVSAEAKHDRNSSSSSSSRAITFGFAAIGLFSTSAAMEADSDAEDDVTVMGEGFHARPAHICVT
jgi:hypothetical protein